MYTNIYKSIQEYLCIVFGSIFLVKDWAEFNCNSINRTNGNYWITKYPLLGIQI